METMNGVINIATGLLLRAGYCDFINDGSFKPEIEAQHGDVPSVFYVLNDSLVQPPSDYVTHWSGEGWDEVPRIDVMSSNAVLS